MIRLRPRRKASPIESHTSLLSETRLGDRALAARRAQRGQLSSLLQWDRLMQSRDAQYRARGGMPESKARSSPRVDSDENRLDRPPHLALVRFHDVDRRVPAGLEPHQYLLDEVCTSAHLLAQAVQDGHDRLDEVLPARASCAAASSDSGTALAVRRQVWRASSAAMSGSSGAVPRSSLASWAGAGSPA